MLSIYICGLAEGQPQARCYVNALHMHIAEEKKKKKKKKGANSLFFFVCHLSILHAVPSAFSQLEVKQWTPGKEALNHSSSLEHRLSPARACKSLKLIFTQHTGKGTSGSKHRLGSHLVQIWLRSFQIAGTQSLFVRVVVLGWWGIL